jgi:hypothetical protein
MRKSEQLKKDPLLTFLINTQWSFILLDYSFQQSQDMATSRNRSHSSPNLKDQTTEPECLAGTEVPLDLKLNNSIEQWRRKAVAYAGGETVEPCAMSSCSLPLPSEPIFAAFKQEFAGNMASPNL